MAIRLTGTNTTGVDANASNDDWFTLEGQLVATSAASDAGFEMDAFTGITYVVAGMVFSGANDAISSNNSSTDTAGHTVTITQTGIVQGHSDGVELNGTGNRIINEGLAIGLGDAALQTQGANGTIVNYGRAESTVQVLNASGDNSIIRNFGQVVGNDGSATGISANGDGVEVTNHGLVEATSIGITISGDLAFMANHGQVTAADSSAAGLSISGDNVLLENHGQIAGTNDGVLVNIDLTGSRLINTGEITGGEDGVDVGSSTGEALLIRNHGLIQTNGTSTSNYAIEGSGGTETIENHDRLIGNLNLLDGDDALIWKQGSSLDGIYNGGNGSDTLDLSDLDHAIWADLWFGATEIWTQGDNDASDAATVENRWARVVDTTGVENIVGTIGTDVFNGNDADNTFGYVGDMVISAIENLDGRGGSDTADFSRFGSGLWADLTFNGGEAWTQDDANANDTSGAFRKLANIDNFENLTGTVQVDAMFGDAGDNTFKYRGDQDFTGIELINGRAGVDTADFSGFGAAVWVDLTFTLTDAEAWTQDDGVAYNTGANRQIADLTGIENLVGTSQSDLLYGDAAANVIDEGGGGNDMLLGRGGFDTFIFSGDFGADTLDDFDANDAEKIDLSGVASISSFTDLTTNHLSDVAGVATITDADGNTITLTGWTSANFGGGNPLDADDFLF